MLDVVEAEHRQHAVVELCIRDLKDQALAHFPSGKFMANAAWTVIACLAHNLLRFTQTIAMRRRRPRFADSSVFEQLFTAVLRQCTDAGLVGGRRLVVDGMHIES